MAKKAGQVQLQVDVNNDEEWEKLLTRRGLIVVDVYSEWCGPCSGMSANLKKIKLEFGGDNLHLATAKSDTITVLHRFKDKSEPTWMFISDHKMVQLVFGINAPKLTRIILEELKKELQFQDGSRIRPETTPSDYSDEEQQRYAIIEKATSERARILFEAKLKALTDTRTANCKHLLETLCHMGLILILPHMVPFALDILADLWEAGGLSVSKKEKPLVTEEMLEELLFFQDVPIQEAARENMLSGEKCLAVTVVQSDNDATGSVDDVVLKFVYGPTKKPPGEVDSPAWLLVKRPKRKSVVKKKSIVVPEAPPPPVEKTEDEDDPDKPVEEEERRTSATSGQENPPPPPEEEMVPVVEEVVEEPEPEPEPEPEEEVPVVVEIEIDGIWVPRNALVKATALKLFFPQITNSLCLPEPEPIPPCIIMAYDAFKRSEINAMINEYSADIMNFGFFTEESADKAKLIAKTTRAFERKAAETTYGEKYIIQISKKRSDAVLAFATLGPTYMSPNVDEGDREAKLFFPEGYDVVEEEEVIEVKKKTSKTKKSKKVAEEAKSSKEAIVPTAAPVPAAVEEVVAPVGGPVEGPVEEPAEGPVEAPGEADKGTSPMDDEIKADVAAPVPAEGAPPESGAPAPPPPEEVPPAEPPAEEPPAPAPEAAPTEA